VSTLVNTSRSTPSGGTKRAASHAPRTAIVAAHAKLNLRLAVLARETSGYHAIETVFHRLALADEVRITLQPQGTRTIRCSVDVGPAQDNLAYRAAAAYLDTAQWATGFAIEILKRIPVRGGLGGGSADAAATLRGLQALQQAAMRAGEGAGVVCTSAAVLELAARIGADVPFLTTDAAMALAWGRGDRLLALDPLPERWVALVVPEVGIDTAEAYQWIADARQMADVQPKDGAQRNDGARRGAPSVLHLWQLANWSEIVPLVRNDFTAVVAERHHFIAQGLAALREAGAVVAEMSGSGSTMFGIFERQPDAEAIARAAGAAVLVTTTATGPCRTELKA